MATKVSLLHPFECWYWALCWWCVLTFLFWQLHKTAQRLIQATRFTAVWLLNISASQPLWESMRSRGLDSRRHLKVTWRKTSKSYSQSIRHDGMALQKAIEGREVCRQMDERESERAIQHHLDKCRYVEVCTWDVYCAFSERERGRLSCPWRKGWKIIYSRPAIFRIWETRDAVFLNSQ